MYVETGPVFEPKIPDEEGTRLAWEAADEYLASFNQEKAEVVHDALVETFNKVVDNG